MFTNPFVQSQQMFDTWTRMTQEQLARMQQMSTEVQELQGQAVERARQAIDETARLMKQSLDYATALSQEWRTIAMESAKKASEAATPKA